MSRDFAQIEAAAKRMQDYQTKSEVMGMPPGYIVGFTVTLRKDYTVLISSGAANVQGLSVQLTQGHQLTGQDWVVQRIDTPNHYYIYLAKEGNVYVDIVQPTWNNQWAYYEQPDTGWRAIGKLFVKSTDIIYAVRQVERFGSTVTVAPNGFTGDADYYCEGTRDDFLINSAILYVSTAYDGGTVILLEGNYYYGQIVFKNRVRLIGSGPATNLVKKNIATTSAKEDAHIISIGTSSANVYNIELSNMKLTRESAETNNIPVIYTYYTDGIKLSDLLIYDYQYNAIYLENSLRSQIINNKIDANSKGPSIGILLDQGTTDQPFLIKGNEIYNISGAGFINCIEIRTGNTALGMIESNKMYSCTRTAAGDDACGIEIKASYIQLVDNSIYNIKNSNTATSVKAIQITSGTSVIVKQNICYNNGSDTGIANTNGDNFSDSGTDTQVYSNSWQSPVSGEPSNGTGHWTGRATPGAWDVTRTAETTAAPYTWDLSGLIPVGTKAVKIAVEAAFSGTGALSAWSGLIWDYDFGAFNVYECLVRGVRIQVSYKPASTGSEYQIGSGHYEVKIGPSRKLYVALSATGGGQTLYAMFRQAVL